MDTDKIGSVEFVPFIFEALLVCVSVNIRSDALEANLAFNINNTVLFGVGH